MSDLFEDAPVTAYEPLASRMRPRSLEEYRGQEHLFSEGKALRRQLEQGSIHSLILWGPPGVGKTTLARLIAYYVDAEFISISAVMDGVKEVRAAVERAKMLRQQSGRQSILFVDEVHRFNKSQQDAFLPYVEEGTLIFIGATTENPSFELNNALLSRARVYPLKALTAETLEALLEQTLSSPRGLADRDLIFEEGALTALAQAADGDARRALNLLEIAADLSEPVEGKEYVSIAALSDVLAAGVRRYDKDGDLFYDQISAFHKSVRGSSSDGALYWYCRMLDAGCDPLYIARRLVAIASEDIGNADPRAMQVVLSAWDAFERVGPAEGERAIAQATIYCALAPKSNAVYQAFNQCLADVAKDPSYEVPEHLRNAPTRLMKEQGFGEGYRYAHNEPNAYAAGESYLPQEIADRSYYHPEERGLEIKLSEKMRRLQAADQASPTKRYPKESS
ncbi:MULTISPECIES: replication-associated recombination protein A [unclassified Marinobacterium]|uniref:replication-associated recombination protein A n=1 Tax=unclassified Marinobacterium TaxID=2644139 RepID=UPI00156A1925|nr:MULTISPECIES: replication-associated recombination protein A [unclassified Marinobacterium]NRP16611.1 Replication-associated recombination protein A [Marinobacterium sp. xm-a-152]NRP48167.1 Replication-associated recombination protein A [Marinobacterium sp. xm-d-543]NRP93949.1 Replication-associated recombination protein A [Marinobacterium sp. xm-g-59]NRQ24390.1 Replication-associated recombination protein A [Marinobacterium sp. xm-m-312]